MWAALQARAGTHGRGSARRGRASSGARQVARLASSPMRSYVNAHFEATKQEFREQVGALARRQALVLDEIAGLDQLTDTIDRLASTVADMHVHQTRTTLGLADELHELRLAVGELRDDVRTLAESIVRLAEGRPAAGGLADE